jgi:transglutaminase-like putative cysteine protease
MGRDVESESDTGAEVATRASDVDADTDADGGGDANANAGRRRSIGVVACCLAALVLLAGGLPALSAPTDYLEFDDTNATIGSGPGPGDPAVEGNGDGTKGPRIGGDDEAAGAAQPADGTVDLGDPPPSADDGVQFVVAAEQPAYWRVTAYDRYVGDGWEASGEPPVRATTPANRSRALLRHEVTLRTPAVVLPVAWRPVGVAGDRETAVGNGSSVRLAAPAAPGDSFDVTSLRPVDDPAALSAADGTYPAAVEHSSTSPPSQAREDAIERRYTALPESVPSRVYARSDRVTGDGGAYATAAAAQRHLRSNYGYDVTRRPIDGDVADTVLFDRETAHASTLAATMAVMLRSQGVPARYVAGYSSGVPDPDNGTYVVRGAHRHWWVEAYVPGAGWVPFDPTPADDRADALRAAGVEPGVGYFDRGNRTVSEGDEGDGGAAAGGNLTAGADAEETRTTDDGTIEGESDAAGAGTESGDRGTPGAAGDDPEGRADGGTPRSGDGERDDEVDDGSGNDPGATGSGGAGADGDGSGDGTTPAADGGTGGDTPEPGGSGGSETSGGDAPREGVDAERSDAADGEGSTAGDADGGDVGEGGTEGQSETSSEASGDRSGSQGGGGETSASESGGGGGGGGFGGTNSDPEYELRFLDDPVPGTSLRVRVLVDGRPWSGVAVAFDGEPVGRTDESGTVAGPVPYETTLNVTAFRRFEPETGLRLPAVRRSASLPTDVAVAPAGTPRPGGEVTLDATIGGVPVPRADVRLDGRLVARTDRSGRATVRLPDEAGEANVTVERGAASGERTLTLAPVSVAVEATPVPLPGRPATVTVSHRDGAPVVGAPVFVDGERVAETDDRGTATVDPGASLEATVAAERGDWRATTTVRPMRNLLAGAGAGLLAALPVAVLARRYGIAPGRALLSLPRRVAATVLLGVVAASRAVDAVLTAAARALGVGSGRSPDPGTLLGGLRAASARLSAAVTTLLPGDGASAGATAATDDGLVRRAWAAVVAAVPERRPATVTPRRIADRAVAAGLPADAVETILAAFRAVEYGDRDPEPGGETIRDALERVDDE